ncbi:MAG: hypothetical protein ACRDFB_02110, partial [Rhabdochlamydiaceae bacterium]
MSYLFPFVYLYLHSMTRIVVDGREVLIQKIPKRSTWKISTPIFEGRGEFPKEIHDCLKLIQQLKWGNEGMLEIDAVIGTIHWTQEIHPTDFGKEFPCFLRHAKE